MDSDKVDSQARMFAVAPALNGNQLQVARPSPASSSSAPQDTLPPPPAPCGTHSTPEDGARAGKVLDLVAHHRNAAVVCA